MKIKISEIRLDGGTQSRDELDNTVINEYCEAMKEGAEFPPVVVFHDEKDYWLSDGFHRVYAATNAKFTEIEADVRKGTVRDAKLFSMSANAKHGKRRTNADKRRAVLMALEDEEWREFSDNEIAKMCDVSQPFVSKVRKEEGYNRYNLDAGGRPKNETVTMLHPDQPLPKPPSEDKEKNELRKQIAYYEELARQDEKVRQEAIDREVKRRVAETVEKRERRQEAEAGRRELSERLEYEGKMRSEFKEKEAKLQREFEIKESALQARIDAKMKQIDEASKLKVDVTSLQREQQTLVSELAGLRLEIEQEKESLNVREQMKKALGAGLAAATVMGLVDKMIAKSSDFCGLSAEDMERYIGKLEEIVSYSSESINTLKGLMEHASQRGGLRVVR